MFFVDGFPYTNLFGLAIFGWNLIFKYYHLNAY